jgi:hypothetical protein
MNTIVTIVLNVTLLTACNSLGKDAPIANFFNQSLAAAPTAEMPAKAADLVAQARFRDRQATTISVVQSAVGMNPAAAPYIVGAVARPVPDMASVAAGAAAAQQPKQASAIAKAAAAAAHTKAGKIVVAVCRAVPDDYRNIAVAVFEAVPGSGNEIVKAVAVTLPELKACIEQALADHGWKVASAPGALTPIVRSPAVGPPYFPPTSAPTNATIVFSGEDPTGGRNYATPYVLSCMGSLAIGRLTPHGLRSSFLTRALKRLCPCFE